VYGCSILQLPDQSPTPKVELRTIRFRRPISAIIRRMRSHYCSHETPGRDVAGDIPKKEFNDALHQQVQSQIWVLLTLHSPVEATNVFFELNSYAIITTLFRNRKWNLE